MLRLLPGGNNYEMAINIISIAQLRGFLASPRARDMRLCINQYKTVTQNESLPGKYLQAQCHRPPTTFNACFRSLTFSKTAAVGDSWAILNCIEATLYTKCTRKGLATSQISSATSALKIETMWRVASEMRALSAERCAPELCGCLSQNESSSAMIPLRCVV